MKNFSSATAFFLSIILLQACYQPEGENFIEISKPDLSNLSINLDAAGDTLYLSRGTTFTFTLPGKIIEAYEVLIDGERYSLVTDARGDHEFYIDRYVGDGIRQLELRITCKSGSHSLADKVNLEKIEISKTWVLIVDGAVPDRLTVTHMDTTQGTMTVHWNRYSNWKFEGYTLVKKCQTSTGYVDCARIEIADSTQVQWTDTDYVGGPVYYRIDLRFSEGKVTGEEKYFISKAAITTEMLPDKKIKVSWTQPTFYKNISRIKFSQDGVLKKTLTDFSDTVFIVDNHYLFGRKIEKAFQLTNEGPTENISYTQNIDFVIGKPVVSDPSYFSFYIGSALFSSKLGQYYLTTIKNNTTYLEIFNENFEFIRERQFRLRSMAISENGLHMYASFYEPDADKDFIFQLDPETLDTTKTFSVKTIFGRSLGPKLEVSNDNLVAYSYTNTNGVGISRMPAREVLTWSNTDAIRSFSVSPDGKYYFHSGRIYEIDADGVATQIHDLGYINADYAHFREDVPHELIIIDNGTVRIVNVPSMTSRYYNLGISTPYVMYDPTSAWLMCTITYQSTQLVNLNSDETFTIQHEDHYNGFMLVNSQIISPAGYKIDVETIKALVE
jgi:hypothetical protein